MLLGVKVLHGLEKKESSGARLILTSAIVGILAGGVIAGVLTPFLAVGIACC
jgi:hypothetical protein